MYEVINWKYEEWVRDICNSSSNTPCTISQYIKQKIYPEDLELLITVLTPKIFEVDGWIFFDADLVYEERVREAYRKKDPIRRSEIERQKDWNSVNISVIFFNTRDPSSDETLANIATLIQHNWEYHLQKLYPDNKFEIEIYGDSFEPYITFGQIDGLSKSNSSEPFIRNMNKKVQGITNWKFEKWVYLLQNSISDIPCEIYIWRFALKI